MPPDPPRDERALLVPSPSPVTLHYSPATTFLNENTEFISLNCLCWVLSLKLYMVMLYGIQDKGVLSQ